MKNNLVGSLLMIAIWYAMFSLLSGVGDSEAPKGIISGTLQVYEDKTDTLTLDQILNQHIQFSDVSGEAPGYFFSSSAFWFHIPLQNLNNQPANLFLNVKYPTLDYVTLYVVDSGNQRQVVETGDRLTRSERPAYLATTLVMPFSVRGSENVDLYVRVRADAAAIIFPYAIMDRDSLRTEMSDRWLVYGILLGLFAAIFMYDLALFVGLKQVVYLYYMGYIFSAYFIIVALDGFGSAIIYPKTPWLANEGLVVFSGLAYCTVLLFTRHSLNTFGNKLADGLMKFMIVVSLLLAVSPFFLPVGLTYRLDVIMMLAVPLSTLPVTIVGLRQKMAGALFFWLANCFLLIGIGVFGLVLMGIVPFLAVTLDVIPNGLLAGALLHFFGTSNKMAVLQDEKMEAERSARLNLEIQQEKLESLIAQRTHELDVARQKAERLAITDPLTGIYNRRGLFDAAERELKLAQRNKHPLAIIVFDLDHFKLINDQFGHAEGDRALCMVTSFVLREIRSTDLFGRIGGEEFLVILPETTGESAIQIAERLRTIIATKVFVGDPPVFVTASLGVAWMVDHNENFDLLQSVADSALYRAKNNGRNKVEIVVR